MDSATFEKWFETGVASTGAHYLKARGAVVQEGAAALPLLGLKTLGEPKATLVAEAWIGWISRRRLYEEITREMQGRIQTEIAAAPITGKWPGTSRARAIAAHGREATPRVLEILTKTREFAGENEEDALFMALGLLKDPRAVPFLVDFLASSHLPELRRRAADALGRIGDPRAFEGLSAGLLDPRGSPELREACAASLGLLGDARGVEPLLAVFLDQRNTTPLRSAAVLAIGLLPGARASLPLAEQLQKEHDPELMSDVLTSLDEVGTADALPILGELASSHPNGAIRQRARGARDIIIRRLRTDVRQ